MQKFQVKIPEKKLLQAIDKKLNEITDEVFASSQELIVEKKIIDEGTLLKSGNINRAFLEKTIIYSAIHADVIEFGRLPGTMPPFNAINAWVKRKGIARKEKEAKKITWAIMQSIKKNGTEPRPFLSPAIEKAANKLRARQ